MLNSLHCTNLEFAYGKLYYCNLEGYYTKSKTI